jgi:GT2 family glycosyltransferase
MTRASFVIPTRGRNAQLLDLLRSIHQQSVASEILVMDDGGSADLAESLRRDFPAVRYFSLAAGRGPSFQRNRGIEHAQNEYVFPLDDDTLLRSPHTVAQTLADFTHPRIAAVAIPYVNVASETRIRHQAPDKTGLWLEHAFTGASHAIRRSAFLEAGGYREALFYMGEERDLCLRLLQRGYVVRVGTADPIEHRESPLRNTRLADYCGRRNDILFAWHNVPSPDLPLHLAGTTVYGVWSALQSQHPLAQLQGIAAGFAAVMGRAVSRQPVERSIYRLHRRLKKQGPLPISRLEHPLAEALRAPA